jgi:hypothetical protein
VSPGRKKETETLLGSKARYVDVAILAPIHPRDTRPRSCSPGRTPRPSCRS